MLKLRKIAVTGEIASGKTTVCRLLDHFGCKVFLSDAYVGQLLKNDAACREQIRDAFGKEIFTKNNQIDKQKLADIVFTNPHKLTQLEQIIHPHVIKAMKISYKKAQKEKAKAFVAEIPLLFETHLDSFFDTIIYVDSPENLRKQRFIQKGYVEKDFLARSKRFLSPEEKKRRAHFILTNDQNLEHLQAQTLALAKDVI